MKRLLLYTLFFALTFAGCQKTTETFLSDPDGRLIETLANYKEQLTVAPDGWIATIFPKGGGGYSFFISFNKSDRVTMISDFNEESSAQPFESTYRLKALQRPTLIFDTYSYIHLLHDPDNTISGGVKGEGLMSDFEFAFADVEADTLKFEGTFNGNKMTLVRATNAEKVAIENGAWLSTITNLKEFVNKSPFTYIEFADNRKLSIPIDPIKKTVILSWLKEDGEVETQISHFLYTIEGMFLEKPLTYGNNSFQTILWDSVAKKFYVNIDSKKVTIESSSNPIIPLFTLLGNGKDYSTIYISGEELPAGIESSFNAVYTNMATLFRTSSTNSRKILYTQLVFSSVDQASLTVRYTGLDASGNNSGSEFSATKTFDYKIVNDVVTFTEAGTNSNWNTRISQIRPLDDYFKGSFKIDWVNNPDPTATGFLGGLSLVGDPEWFFYGVLIK